MIPPFEPNAGMAVDELAASSTDTSAVSSEGRGKSPSLTERN